MIHQIAGNLVVKVQRCENKSVTSAKGRSKSISGPRPSMKSPTSFSMQGVRRPEMQVLKRDPLPHIIRTYQLTWQGTVVPISDQVGLYFSAAVFCLLISIAGFRCSTSTRGAMRYELSLFFNQYCDRLCACKLLSQKAVKAG